MPFTDPTGEDSSSRPYRYYGFLVATIVLVAVAGIRLRGRDRSRTDETAYHDREPNAFREVVDRSEVYTLDVHTPEQRHIEGTDAFVPYDEIRDYRHLLPDDKDTPIALYCRSDTMSRQVTDLLSDLGYEEIYHLQGGLQAWSERDLPFTAHRFGEPGVRTADRIE